MNAWDLVVRTCSALLLISVAVGCAHDPHSLDRGLAKDLLVAYWSNHPVDEMVQLFDRDPDSVASVPAGARVDQAPYLQPNAELAAYLKSGYAETRYENQGSSFSADWKPVYSISSKGQQQHWRRDTNTSYVPIATMGVGDVTDLQVVGSSATASYNCTAIPNDLGKQLLADGLSKFSASPALSDAVALPLGKPGTCTATLTQHDDGWKLVTNPDA